MRVLVFEDAEEKGYDKQRLFFAEAETLNDVCFQIQTSKFH